MVTLEYKDYKNKMLFRKILEKNRWLAQSLVTITGLSGNAIYNIANSKTEPFWDTKYKIFEALKNLDLINENITMDDLFSKTEIDEK